jgi:hypothetical protein
VLVAKRGELERAGLPTGELDVIIDKQRDRVATATREYPKKLAIHLARCIAAGCPDSLGRTSADITAARKAAEEIS